MIRPMLPEDRDAAGAFLARHADTSMFLRSNLAAQAAAAGDGPATCDFWLQTDGTRLQAVFALTRDGTFLLQAPDAPPDWRGLRPWLAGRTCSGMNGAADQIAFARAGLGLTRAGVSLDRVEPVLTQDLSGYSAPVTDAAIRPAVDDDITLLAQWRKAYLMEIMGVSDPGQAENLAAAQARRMVAGGQTRLLAQGGEPLAMTAFNARVQGMVQVGSVYTPAALRGRGHARTAVALHLAEAAAEGARRAVLFAASPAARRAYEAIGFRSTGAYHLIGLAVPTSFGGPE